MSMARHRKFRGICGSLIISLILFQSASASAAISGKNLLTEKQIELGAGKKGTVVVFMSARCPCSNSHLAPVKNLAEEFKDFSFLIVHANSDEPEEISKPYFQAAGLSFPVIEDENGALADEFKALKTPHAFLIGPDGNILYKGGVTNSSNGESASKHYLREALADANAGRSLRTAETRTLGCLISRGKK